MQRIRRADERTGHRLGALAVVVTVTAVLSTVVVNMLALDCRVELLGCPSSDPPQLLSQLPVTRRAVILAVVALGVILGLSLLVLSLRARRGGAARDDSGAASLVIRLWSTPDALLQAAAATSVVSVVLSWHARHGFITIVGTVPPLRWRFLWIVGLIVGLSTILTAILLAVTPAVADAPSRLAGPGPRALGLLVCRSLCATSAVALAASVAAFWIMSPGVLGTPVGV